MLALIAAPATAQPARKPGPSGLALPRFVSLKSAEVNVRRGPGLDHGISFIYRRAGLPVEIIAEFDTWRRVRDADGQGGWVLGNLLSARRNGQVAPWRKGEIIDLSRAPEPGALVVARAQAGLIARIDECTGSWCRIDAGKARGWLPQSALWGAYPGETVSD